MDTVVRNPSSPGDDITPILSIKGHNGPVYNLTKMQIGRWSSKVVQKCRTQSHGFLLHHGKMG